jgi:hypothetical protein
MAADDTRTPARELRAADPAGEMLRHVSEATWQDALPSTAVQSRRAASGRGSRRS